MITYLIIILSFFAGVLTVLMYQAKKRVNEYFLRQQKIEDNKTYYQKLNISINYK